jgi:FixJ family two-component response regulator
MMVKYGAHNEVNALAMSPPRPRVAVVDDDESICRALKRLLRTFGMDAETFVSSEQFIEVVTASPAPDVDCVVLDLQMPGMNGFQVQERLAAHGRSLPIVFITAYDEVGARERALGAGAVAFMRKPFSEEILIATLQAALRLPSAATS